MKTIWILWIRFFYAQCYAFCKSEAYMSSQRGDSITTAEWQTKADEWYLEWWRIGRTLK